MNKHDVVKALALCNDMNDGVCADCPYAGAENCYKRLTADALALLKSEPEQNNSPAYHTAYVYTKHDNLSKWFKANINQLENVNHYDVYQRLRDHYAQEREIQLVLLVRHDTTKCKCYCKIKCPINPLPIKGEFETTTVADVGNLIMTMGWKFSHKVKLNF